MNRFLKQLVLTTLITFIIFFLFEEDKKGILDFGSKCSNHFILRTSIQTIFMTLVFYFTSKSKENSKE